MDAPVRSGKAGLALFCAEQGFAGAFSERALDAVGADLAKCELFLIGSRGVDLAAQRNIHADWTDAMPSHGLGAPKLADRITEALYRRIASEAIVQFDVAFTVWAPGEGLTSKDAGCFRSTPRIFRASTVRTSRWSICRPMRSWPVWRRIICTHSCRRAAFLRRGKPGPNGDNGGRGQAGGKTACDIARNGTPRPAGRNYRRDHRTRRRRTASRADRKLAERDNLYKKPKAAKEQTKKMMRNGI